MKRFIRHDTVPPGGWRYVVPETSTTIRSGNEDELKLAVKKHLIANGKPVPADIGALIEDQLCQLIGPEWCTWGTSKFNIDPNMKASDVLRGTKVLASWKLEGSPLVDQNEAERRAAICGSCMMNIPVGGCWGCSGLQQLVSKLTDGNKTSHDSTLQSCAVCKCSNRAQVWLPLDTLWRGVTSDINESFPDHCWKKRM
jgi:hypothetical protein